eukprot:comp21131_c0_seq2/m.28573 comp21131_c0_seq2/g.28573  ORF comp21131_c0_seq2/g.28573 comp21131_c0_seq2/m.28573 type:complete len:233 (-) comp21131_c0_seq2:203-901(-)
MSDLLDKPLDDIVKETGVGRRGRGRGRGARGGAPRGGSSGGAVRNNSRGRGARSAPYSAEKPAPRAPAPPPKPRLTATKVLVENLAPTVNDADVKELFGQCGTLKKVAVHYTAQGRSLGTAEVVYVRPEDAARAVKEYNGVTLDGRPMKLIAVDEEPRSNVLSRISAPAPAQPRQRDAIQYTDDGRWSRGGGARGGRGGRGSAPRGGRGGRAPRENKSQADLDAELDSYHTK